MTAQPEIPRRRRRRFVPRAEFAAGSRTAPSVDPVEPVDLDAFRADQDAATDHDTGDPYTR